MTAPESRLTDEERAEAYALAGVYVLNPTPNDALEERVPLMARLILEQRDALEEADTAGTYAVGFANRFSQLADDARRERDAALARVRKLRRGLTEIKERGWLAHDHGLDRPEEYIDSLLNLTDALSAGAAAPPGDPPCAVCGLRAKEHDDPENFEHASAAPTGEAAPQ